MMPVYCPNCGRKVYSLAVGGIGGRRCDRCKSLVEARIEVEDGKRTMHAWAEERKEAVADAND
jgi:hypothetical protein